MTSRRALVASLFAGATLVVFTTTVYPADIYLPGFDRALEKKGVSAAYTKESARNLVRILDARLQENVARAAGAKSEDDRSDLDVQRRILVSARERALMASEALNLEDASAGYEAFIQAKRIYYAHESEVTAYKDHNFFQVIGILVRSLFRSGRAVPDVEPREMSQPVGMHQALKEAACLVDADGRYVTRERIADMRHEEIASLDVSESNLAYYTNSSFARVKSEGIDPWQRLERAVEASVEMMDEAGVRRPYSLEKARRVLFFDSAEASATSPKINVRDAFGKKWRIKWGNSVQPEAIASRLYVLIGGKYTDLVYANGPRTRNDLVLVLAAPDSRLHEKGENAIDEQTKKPSHTSAESRTQCAPQDASDLVDCLHRTYDCDLRPWIASTGVITRDTVDQVLAQLPSTSRKEYQKGNLIGRHYVVFRESLVEFRDQDGVARVGTNALSTTHAREDRGIRGGLVFHMWINNIDAKDRNNTTALMEDGTLAESPHDLGGTLGSRLGDFGNLNRLEPGDSFIHIKDGRKIVFRVRVLYEPKAWKAATFADGMWMARKIASLGRQEIVDSVRSSGWPEFMENALVERLIDRRNAISRAFRVSSPMITAPVNYAVGLGAEDLAETAAQTGLDLGIVREAVEAARGRHPPVPAEDRLVVDGRINRCYETVLLGIMEEELHPSGLSRRVRHKTDDKPLPACRWKDRPKHRPLF